ncbi:MAG: hypothetical protein KCHDKBKB_02897 [Elusimicrobia bacterium]|nr:hypothetical protein [Elusimicrobiota bacterium]
MRLVGIVADADEDRVILPQLTVVVPEQARLAGASRREVPWIKIEDNVLLAFVRRQLETLTVIKDRREIRRNNTFFKHTSLLNEKRAWISGVQTLVTSPFGL